MKTFNTKNRIHTVLSGLAISAVMVACGPQEDFYLEPVPLPAAGETSLVHLDTNPTYTHPFDGLTKDVEGIGMGRPDTIEDETAVMDAFEELAEIDEPKDIEVTPQIPFVGEAPSEDTPLPEASEDDENAQMNPIEDSEIDAPAPMGAERLPTISELSVNDFDITCKAIDALYKDIQPDTIARGQCIYDYALADLNLSAIEPVLCTQNLNTCLADTEEVRLPVTLCDDRETVPADCNVNVAAVEQCVMQFRNTQTQLANNDVCGDNPFQLGITNRLLRLHQNAHKCIQDLADECPALVAE